VHEGEAYNWVLGLTRYTLKKVPDRTGQGAGMVEASCRPAVEGHTRRNAQPSETINKQTWLDELVELLKVNLTHLKDNFEKL